MGKNLKVASVVAITALTAAACSSAPSSSSAPASASPTAAKFLACMVTDTGGINDRSFNAASWQGVLNAEKDLGVTGKYLQSTTQNDYATNINTFIKQGCGIIVTVGFLMAQATDTAAAANKTVKFAIVDNNNLDAKNHPIPNLLGLQFDTSQSGFLGGYLAAGMTKTGKVATFGGIEIPPVSIYMDGFWDGVQYYNSKHMTHVQVLGWNEQTQKGSFTGDFTNQAKGEQLTQQFITEGADIVFPVAGNVGLGAAKAVQNSGGKANMLWVDVDGCVSAPQYCPLFISSVEKGISAAVESAIKRAMGSGTFTGSYTGTLANGGAALAPFHQWASKVPASLQAELKTVEAGIISGMIKVNTKNGV